MLVVKLPCSAAGLHLKLKSLKSVSELDVFAINSNKIQSVSVIARRSLHPGTCTQYYYTREIHFKNIKHVSVSAIFRTLPFCRKLLSYYLFSGRPQVRRAEIIAQTFRHARNYLKSSLANSGPLFGAPFCIPV